MLFFECQPLKNFGGGEMKRTKSMIQRDKRNKREILIVQLFSLANFISLREVRLGKAKNDHKKQQINWQTKVAVVDLKKTLSRLEGSA